MKTVPMANVKTIVAINAILNVQNAAIPQTATAINAKIAMKTVTMALAMKNVAETATRYAMMKSAKTVVSAINAETVNALTARKTTVTVSYVLIVKSAQRAANADVVRNSVPEDPVNVRAKSVNILDAVSVILAVAVTTAINPDVWARFVKPAADAV